MVCVSVRIFLSVCQHGSVTPEPLEILSRDFQGLMLWAKTGGHVRKWKMATYGCAACGLTSLASIVSNIIRLFSS